MGLAGYGSPWPVTSWASSRPLCRPLWPRRPEKGLGRAAGGRADRLVGLHTRIPHCTGPDLLTRSARYSWTVSQIERAAAQKALQELTADDRAWLEERLVEYRELLDYLHEH